MRFGAYNMLLTVKGLEDEVYWLKKYFQEGRGKCRTGLIKPHCYKTIYELINSIGVFKQDLLQKHLYFSSDHKTLLRMYNKVCVLESDLYNLMNNPKGLSSLQFNTQNGKQRPFKNHYCEDCDESFLHKRKKVMNSHNYLFQRESSESSIEFTEDIIHGGNYSSPDTSTGSEYESNLLPDSEEYNYYEPHAKKAPYIDVRSSNDKYLYKKAKPHSKKEVKIERSDVSERIYGEKRTRPKKHKYRSKQQLEGFGVQKSQSANFRVDSKKAPKQESQIYFIRQATENAKDKFGDNTQNPKKEKYYISRMNKPQPSNDEVYDKKYNNPKHASYGPNIKHRNSRKYKYLGSKYNENFRKNMPKQNTNFRKDRINYRGDPNTNIFGNKHQSTTVGMFHIKQPTRHGVVSNSSNIPVVTSKYFLEHFNSISSSEEMPNHNNVSNNNKKNNNYAKTKCNTVSRNRTSKPNKEYLLLSKSSNTPTSGSKYEIVRTRYFQPKLHESNGKRQNTATELYSVIHNPQPKHMNVSEYVILRSSIPKKGKDLFRQSAHKISKKASKLKLSNKMGKSSPTLSMKSSKHLSEINNHKDIKLNEGNSVESAEKHTTYKNKDQLVFTKNSIKMKPQDESTPSLIKDDERLNKVQGSKSGKIHNKRTASKTKGAVHKSISVPLKKHNSKESDVGLSHTEKKSDIDITEKVILSSSYKDVPKQEKIIKKPHSSMSKHNPTSLAPNQEPLVYSLKFSREKRKKTDMDSVYSTLSLDDMLTSNCKPVSVTEEFHLSEHKFNGTEMHNKFDKVLHHSGENQSNWTCARHFGKCPKKGNLCYKFQKDKITDIDSCCSNVHFTKSVQAISECSAALDWKSVVQEIKECK